jgi:hypothetical protein
MGLISRFAIQNAPHSCVHCGQPFKQNGERDLYAWRSSPKPNCVIALRELNASKNSFDFAWIEAIERTGHYDYTSLFAADCASKADAATARGALPTFYS